MKKFLLGALLLLSTHCFCQTIVENNVDKFTHVHIIRTSWEKFFNKTGFSQVYIGNIRIEKLDSLYGIRIAIMHTDHDFYTIPINPGIMFMLDNDSIIILHPAEPIISSIGGGCIGKLSGSACAGEEIHCFLSTNNLILFKQHSIKMFRYYTTSGFIEYEIKDKNFIKLKELFSLIN